MNDRIYIDDFCEDLNYHGVILYIRNVNKERLKDALEKSYVNKLWRLDPIVNSSDPSFKDFMYVENCDLQDLCYPVHEYVEEGYDVYILHEDIAGFYVKKKLYERVIKEKEVPKYVPPYTPVCPRGYEDCVWDPAYIKHNYPEWYKNLYGDLTPEEAIATKNGCLERVERDPDETYYCYDDEDK